MLAGDEKGNLSQYPVPSGPAAPLAPAGMLLDVTPDGSALLTTHGPTVTIWDWPAGRRRRDVAVTVEAKSAAISPAGRTGGHTGSPGSRTVAEASPDGETRPAN